MREGWKEVKLADYYTISSGLSKSADQFGSGFPFVSFKNVFWNFFLPEELTELVNTTEKDRNTCSVKRGDVFLTRTSEKIEELGMSSVALKDYPNATFNGFTKRLRPKNGKDIDPRYIGFYLRTPQFRAEITAYSSLTTRASLNNDIIGRLRILLPALTIQSKIGSILSAYDNLIENNLKRIKLLEEKAQLTYEEWFEKMRFPSYETVKFDEVTGLPEGWKKGIFQQYFKVNNGYAFKSHDYTLGGTKILRTRDYSQTKWVHFDQPIYLTNEMAKKYEKYQIKAYDLMLIMVGASIGNYGIILPKDLGALQNQNQWAIRAKQNYMELYKILMMESLIKSLLGKKTGAARDFFRASFLNEMEVIIPDEKIISDFNKVLNPIFEMINKLFQQMELSKEARDLLLPRLMSGMIDVEKLEIELLQITE